ncbi:hypothetical protein K1719_018266 [Acacia pycnantha]|nr:hypothetical protein K1719_018266 [Acacia pycnantha]
MLARPRRSKMRTCRLASHSNPCSVVKHAENEVGDDETVKKEALQIIGLFHNLPRLVFFDLDYTLCNFYWFLKWV